LTGLASAAAMALSVFAGWFFFDRAEHREGVDAYVQACREDHPEAVRNPSSPGSISFNRAGRRPAVCVYGELDGLGPQDIRMMRAIRPEVLVVRSSGGAVAGWLDFVEAFDDRPRLVIVDGLCASSCANYAFAAGRRRIVGEDSLVIWHGGPVDAPQVFERMTGLSGREDPGQIREDFQDLAVRTSRLYDRWRLDPAILVHTIVSPPSQADLRASRQSEADMVGFALSPSVLERCFGFRQLHFLRYPESREALIALSRSRFGGRWAAMEPQSLQTHPCLFAGAG
jgi:hypothetical protein